MLTIDDSLNKDSKLIFICESPHIDEVKLGFPLAGYSGREMSKYLLGDDSISLGSIARDFSSYQKLGLKPFSIMNASQAPLQISAYKQNNLILPENIFFLERIRKIRDLSNVETDLLPLVNLMFKSFKNRCQHLSEMAVFVPCGVFARSFCKHLARETSGNFKYLDNIPHPSRAQWKTLTPMQLSQIAIKT
jgi:hypothetical protein